MKNLNIYDQDTFEFHKKVVGHKRNSEEDPTYKARVSALNDAIEKQFKKYDEKFDEDKLETLHSLGYTGDEKKILHKLYVFKSKVLQELKVQLTTDENNRIINTCQNCTISEVNSFDHLIPKEEFAEYVVNPKNLFPCCTTCNSLKSTAWREDNKRIFLNLYLDELPDVQFLFVEVMENSGELDLRYYLENKYGIDPELFHLIESHYYKLNLFQRFKESSDSVISEFETSINAFIKKLPIEDIKETIIEECEKNKKAFGHNYWKSILKMTLVNDFNYMSRFDK
ncbi:MAG: HNH endonuclease [Deltaproteobacteria bacterium]|nr:HNH endonuclease [Deltaproteobacteria bacterium]